MRTIAIVESGQYEDHQVMAVFESEEDALAYATDYNTRERPAWNDRATVGTINFYPSGNYHRVDTVVDEQFVEIGNLVEQHFYTNTSKTMDTTNPDWERAQHVALTDNALPAVREASGPDEEQKI